MAERGSCSLPPSGWFCSLEVGHDGPCPTWPEVPMPLSKKALRRRVVELEAQLAKATAPPTTVTFTQHGVMGQTKRIFTMSRGETQIVELYRMYLANDKPVWDQIAVEVTLT